MRVALVTLAAAAALVAWAAAAGATTRTTTMTLTCRVAPGVTRVTGITDDKSHFRFQWWYANGSTYKSPAWAYYTNALSKGKLTVRTHGHPVRAMATEHRYGGGLVRVRAACS